MQFVCVFSIAPDGCSLGQDLDDDSKGNVSFTDVNHALGSQIKGTYSTIISDVNRRTGHALCFYG